MLVTRAEVLATAQGNAPRLVSDAGFLDTCVATASAVLDQYLGYGSTVHVTEADIVTHGTQGAGYFSFPVGPASVALTAGYTVDRLGRLAYTTFPADPFARYLAGWRPYGAAVTEDDVTTQPPMSNADLLALLNADGVLNGADGLPLTAAALAPVRSAPAAVRSALAEAAVAVALRLGPGLVGVRTSTLDIGMATRTTTTASQFAGDDEITAIIASRCAPYRHIHV